MTIPESFDTASERLRLALPLMSKYRVPIAPLNYAVWYEYVAGTSPVLRDVIDHRIQAEQVIDETVTRELYQRYVDPSDQTRVQAAQLTVRRLLETMSGSLDDADSEVTRYEKSLRASAAQLTPDIEAEALRGLVDGLISSTQKMNAGNAALHQHLQESRREADALRDELAKVRVEAHTDPLTGLANRRAFLTRLQQGVALAGRRGAGLAVVFMDLDGFKAVNDNHGHAVGDNLLQQVARRLKEGLRLSDSVGRLGGDEFLLLLQDCPDRESAAMIAQKLIAQISDPYTLGEVQVIIGASMGIAMFPEHANEPQELIALADAAMYAAKRGGRKTFRFSEAATDPVAQSRVDSHVSDRNATKPK